MGKLECSRHGDAGGPLACDHIRDSAYQGEPMPQTCAVALTFDPDIEETVESIVCDACANEWKLSDGCRHAFPSGKGSYPRVVPVCVVCYREACAKVGRADKLKVVCIEPGDDVPIDELRAQVEWLVPRKPKARVNARFVEAVEVREMHEGRIVWQGAVKVFDLAGEVEAKRAYAWSHPMQGKRRVVVIPQSPRVDSPVAAVRMVVRAHLKGL